MYNHEEMRKFKERYPLVDLVYKIDKPHIALEYDRPIEVYCESIVFSKDKTWFWLYDNGNYVGNYLAFPCSIKYGDVQQIAKDMVEELLLASDFYDLDLALKNEVPCEEYKNKYKSCDECSLYTFSENADKNAHNLCLGSMYSIPTHMNSWQKTEEKWNKIYGEGSLNHKEYIFNQMKSHMNDFMNVCGNEKEMIKELLKYGKEHWCNKFPKLFK